MLAFWGCASSQLLQEDAETKEKMVVGKCSFADWKRLAEWSTYDAPDYAPDAETVARIAPLVKSPDVSFILFGGSWCGDTKTEFPKYFKLFSALNLPEPKVALYGVNRKKREGSGVAERFNLKRVPTLVVLRGDKEIGRIVEYPTETLEKDLLKILTK
ncbi:MAG: thioredoxin family protein [Chloroherpetonaceae bacterium]|nr:thioredoxin family protein [Chloroherpetonaceae bacterium]MDW8437909.1 thioredoxin family protein [Chloroherpetonaceae bacterium]